MRVIADLFDWLLNVTRIGSIGSIRLAGDLAISLGEVVLHWLGSVRCPS